MEAKQQKKYLIEGICHFSLFLVLIAAGIVAKRVYGHPEWMMLFHGPAAIFLVVAGMRLTLRQRERYGLELKKLERLIKS